MTSLVQLLDERTSSKTSFLIDEGTEDGINNLRERFAKIPREDQKFFSFRTESNGFYTKVPYFMKAVCYHIKYWDFRQDIKTNMNEYFLRSKLAKEKKHVTSNYENQNLVTAG